MRSRAGEGGVFAGGARLSLCYHDEEEKTLKIQEKSGNIIEARARRQKQCVEVDRAPRRCDDPVGARGAFAFGWAKRPKVHSYIDNTL